MQEQTLELNIANRGDSSVGLDPIVIKITSNIYMSNYDNEQREELRKAAIEFFQTFFSDDFKIDYASFIDECPECNKMKTECICPDEI
jgi:hypothetical protein